MNEKKIWIDIVESRLELDNITYIFSIKALQGHQASILNVRKEMEGRKRESELSIRSSEIERFIHGLNNYPFEEQDETGRNLKVYMNQVGMYRGIRFEQNVGKWPRKLTVWVSHAQAFQEHLSDMGAIMEIRWYGTTDYKKDHLLAACASIQGTKISRPVPQRIRKNIFEDYKNMGAIIAIDFLEERDLDRIDSLIDMINDIHAAENKQYIQACRKMKEIL